MDKTDHATGIAYHAAERETDFWKLPGQQYRGLGDQLHSEVLRNNCPEVNGGNKLRKTL